MKYEDNQADQYTTESPGLEASISPEAFMQILKSWGPFQWDIMTSATNVIGILKIVELFFQNYDPSPIGDCSGPNKSERDFLFPSYSSYRNDLEIS